MKSRKTDPWKAALLTGFLLLAGGCRHAVPPPLSGEGPKVRSAVTGFGGVRLHTAERGPSEAPAIVLVHGLGRDHTTWDSLEGSDLARRYRLIAPDLRGHGLSGRPRDPAAYASAAWAGDLKALLDHYGLERPILLGWSFGGRVVLDYVSLYGPDDLSGIVLVAVSAEGGDGLRRRSAGARASPSAPAWIAPAVREGKRRDHGKTLEGIGAPVLILQGSRDLIVPPSSADYIAAHAPGVTKLVFDGVGHEVHRELGERFERILLDFADGVYGRGP